LTDQDARPAGSSSSVAHLWDSGTNAVDELNRLMQVRGAALKRFGENNIREGAPLATLEDVLVPLYMPAPLSSGSGEQARWRDGLHVCAARRRTNADADCRACGTAARAGGGAGNAKAGTFWLYPSRC